MKRQPFVLRFLLRRFPEFDFKMDNFDASRQIVRKMPDTDESDVRKALEKMKQEELL